MKKKRKEKKNTKLPLYVKRANGTWESTETKTIQNHSLIRNVF